MAETKHPAQRRYPPELRERGVRMVLEAFEQGGERHGVVARIARQLGVGVESLRGWVKQAEIDGGRRAGTTTVEKERIATGDRAGTGAIVKLLSLARIHRPVVGERFRRPTWQHHVRGFHSAGRIAHWYVSVDSFETNLSVVGDVLACSAWYAVIVGWRVAFMRAWARLWGVSAGAPGP